MNLVAPHYLVIHTDGGSRGNPGPAAIGFVISDEQGEIVHEQGEYIGTTTNNVAEYTAVIKAIQWLKHHSSQPKQIQFNLDSLLVVNQLMGKFKIRQHHLLPLFQKIHLLLKEINANHNFTYIPRSQNVRADSLVNMALDQLSY